MDTTCAANIESHDLIIISVKRLLALSNKRFFIFLKVLYDEKKGGRLYAHSIYKNARLRKQLYLY